MLTVSSCCLKRLPLLASTTFLRFCFDSFSTKLKSKVIVYVNSFSKEMGWLIIAAHLINDQLIIDNEPFSS